MIKNVHVLPTDKPSKLYLGDNGNFVFGLIQSSIKSKNNNYTNQNIYITNDEDIKEGDWFINDCESDAISILYKCLEIRQFEYIRSEFDQHDFKDCKKIILTTDQDLIKDGVQAIDDDFLEWFVKNPSCDNVEVMPIGFEDREDYLIIIPKEEPCDNCNNEVCCCIIRKQETLEEAAQKYSKNELSKLGFLNGVKWQQEQEKITTDDAYNEGFENGKNWQQERSYSFDNDLLLLSEHKEASEHWKELPEKLLNEIEYNKILDKIDKSKIYFKDVEVKNVDDILNKLLIGSFQTSINPTFYKYNNVYYNQCIAGKYRSFDDILLICKTYFPSVKVETVFKKLLLLNNTKSSVLNDELNQRFGYCGDIRRIRYIGNYSLSLQYFYSNAITCRQGESKYSWKDLFKMININNVEELKEFYLKNLKDEI